jgi:hypothetical protein
MPGHGLTGDGRRKLAAAPITGILPPANLQLAQERDRERTRLGAGPGTTTV